MYYVLCNPLSANKQGVILSQSLIGKLSDEELEFVDIRTVERYTDFWKRIDFEKDIVAVNENRRASKGSPQRTVGVKLACEM